MGFGMVEQRKLEIMKIASLLRNICPIDQNALIDELEFETGFTPERLYNFVGLYKRRGNLVKNDKGLIEWKENPKK
jgi:hypothetical protein